MEPEFEVPILSLFCLFAFANSTGCSSANAEVQGGLSRCLFYAAKRTS